MRALFAEIPGACDATLEIAERCNVDTQTRFHLVGEIPAVRHARRQPARGIPDASLPEGLVKRYGEQRANEPEIAARLKYEVDTINQLGFASYFLITADFIQWARDHDIPVGPGRGSAAGSLVSYAMGITDICPLRFGLLFERFLNPERVSPPDVDIDFCQSRRAEVIDYVRQKYGERCVSHIITYGTMGAKSVIRDVARVMGMSYGDGDRHRQNDRSQAARKGRQGQIQRLHPAARMDKNPELRELIESSSSPIRNSGTTRSNSKASTATSASTPPASSSATARSTNMSRSPAATKAKSSPSMTWSAITDVGLLKMDFLGLKNLTVIHEAVRPHPPPHAGFRDRNRPAR